MAAIVDLNEVVTEIRVGDETFDRKMRRIRRELDETERDAKRKGRARGAAIAGGIAGAVAGAAVGAATQNAAVQGILDLILNILAAAILPLLVSMLPLIQEVTPLLMDLSETLAPGVTLLANKVAEVIRALPGPRGGEGSTMVDSGLGFDVPVHIDKDKPQEEGVVWVSEPLWDWFKDKASSARRGFQAASSTKTVGGVFAV